MKFLHSIRWRLQIWYGLLLVAVGIAGAAQSGPLVNLWHRLGALCQDSLPPGF